VIADLTFGDADPRGVRVARFVPRTNIPLSAACLVANGLRETLRDLLGEPCELGIGEPAAIGPQAWATLSRDAYCFVTPGRQTDTVLVVPESAARALVMRAFGEQAGATAGPLSTLELAAVERIAARCASAFDSLCAQRHGSAQRVGRADLPACVAFFDVRISAPISIELGIGIVRDLPDPAPIGRLPPAALARVPVTVRAEFASGTIDVATLLALAPGDIIALETQVGAAGSLKIADRSFASGSGGVQAGRYSFEVRTLAQSVEARS